MSILQGYTEATVILNELFGIGKKKTNKKTTNNSSNPDDSKMLQLAISDLKYWLSHKGIDEDENTVDMSGMGLAYYDTSQKDIDDYAKSASDASGDTISYVEDCIDDDDYSESVRNKCQVVVKYFKNKKVCAVSTNGGGDTMIYCKEDRSFYEFYHDEVPQINLSDKMSLSTLKSKGLQALKNDKYYVQADAEIGEYRLSQKPTE